MAMKHQTNLEEVKEELKAGQSLRDICRARGVSAPWIYRRLSKEGYVFRDSNTWSATLTLPDDPGLIGYIAGIIDGEGSILHTKEGYWTVKVGMTDEPIMRWLASLGGTLHFTDRSAMPNHKNIWNWNVSRHKDVNLLLQALLPYLIVKRTKAETCLADLNPPGAARLHSS